MLNRSRIVFLVTICLIARTGLLYAGPLEDCAYMQNVECPANKESSYAEKGIFPLIARRIKRLTGLSSILLLDLEKDKEILFTKATVFASL